MAITTSALHYWRRGESAFTTGCKFVQTSEWHRPSVIAASPRRCIRCRRLHTQTQEDFGRKYNEKDLQKSSWFVNTSFRQLSFGAASQAVIYAQPAIRLTLTRKRKSLSLLHKRMGVLPIN